MPSPKTITDQLWAARQQRAAPRVAPVFHDPRFPEQRAFLDDVSPLKLAFCTRRAGKSYGLGLHLFRDAYATPGVKCLYLAKTRDSAKGILWHDVLAVINRTLKLNAKPNATELSWTLPNGSMVRMLGADSDQDEKDKLLGQKYQTVAIDEAEAFRTDVASLVYGTLKPAVADRRGTIILTGTPANMKAGMFFDVTGEQDASSPGSWTFDHQQFGGRWSCHRWSAFQNPHMREQWAGEIADLKAVNPRIDETPLFQQNYLGRWAVDDTKLVYRYQPGRNDFDGELPILARGDWHYVLGIDLGFNDATSFTVAAYHDHHRHLYYLSSYKKSGLDLTAVTEHADALKTRYPIDTTVIDGANKQAVEEMNARHGLNAVAADKTGKADFIAMMNSDLIQGYAKMSPDCESLRDEWLELIWDERALLKAPPKQVEHPGCENHCADGALYIWRHCHQYTSTALPPPPPAINTPEWYAAEMARQEAEIREQLERQVAANRQEQRDTGDALDWL